MIRCHSTGDGFDEAGLACTVITNHTQHFAWVKVKISAIQSHHSAIALEQAARFENRNAFLKVWVVRRFADSFEMRHFGSRLLGRLLFCNHFFSAHFEALRNH